MDSSKKQNSVTTIVSETTKFYADSVECCHLEPFQDFFLCGTYQMEDDDAKSIEHSQVRKGNITLLEISKNSDVSEGFLLKTKTDVDSSGVLDMKWAPHHINKKCTFGVAFSDGCVQLQQVSKNEENVIELTALCGASVATENKSLALSLDWSTWKYVTPENIIVSDSSGNLNHLSLSNTSLNLQKWKAHDFEAWIAAFDYDNINIVYSGGDDCLFKSWDLRTSMSTPLFVNKSHTMGVTSAIKNRDNEHLLATGSYDEYVRIWDTRRMKYPVHEVHVGGGIWRIKWHPFSTKYILVAAMHHGFHILQLDYTLGVNVIASYNEHKSLAYGVDWHWFQYESSFNIPKEDHTTSSSSMEETDNVGNTVCWNTRNIIASCSFYDRSLHLWSVDL